MTHDLPSILFGMFIENYQNFVIKLTIVDILFRKYNFKFIINF